MSRKVNSSQIVKHMPQLSGLAQLKQNLKNKTEGFATMHKDSIDWTYPEQEVNAEHVNNYIKVPVTSLTELLTVEDTTPFEKEEIVQVKVDEHPIVVITDEQPIIGNEFQYQLENKIIKEQEVNVQIDSVTDNNISELPLGVLPSLENTEQIENENIDNVVAIDNVKQNNDTEIPSQRQTQVNQNQVNHIDTLISQSTDKEKVVVNNGVSQSFDENDLIVAPTIKHQHAHKPKPTLLDEQSANQVTVDNNHVKLPKNEIQENDNANDTNSIQVNEVGHGLTSDNEVEVQVVKLTEMQNTNKIVKPVESNATMPVKSVDSVSVNESEAVASAVTEATVTATAKVEIDNDNENEVQSNVVKDSIEPPSVEVVQFQKSNVDNVKKTPLNIEQMFKMTGVDNIHSELPKIDEEVEMEQTSSLFKKMHSDEENERLSILNNFDFEKRAHIYVEQEHHVDKDTEIQHLLEEYQLVKNDELQQSNTDKIDNVEQQIAQEPEFIDAICLKTKSEFYIDETGAIKPINQCLVVSSLIPSEYGLSFVENYNRTCLLQKTNIDKLNSEVKSKVASESEAENELNAHRLAYFEYMIEANDFHILIPVLATFGNDSLSSIGNSIIQYGLDNLIGFHHVKVKVKETQERLHTALYNEGINVIQKAQNGEYSFEYEADTSFFNYLLPYTPVNNDDGSVSNGYTTISSVSIDGVLYLKVVISRK